MRESILDLIGNGNTLTTEDVILRIALSILLGFVIFISYKITHVGTIYSRKFNVRNCKKINLQILPQDSHSNARRRNESMP